MEKERKIKTNRTDVVACARLVDSVSGRNCFFLAFFPDRTRWLVPRLKGKVYGID